MMRELVTFTRVNSYINNVIEEKTNTTSVLLMMLKR